ncbi:MAG: hypothetical protein L0312_18660 [Acidobacteria bacterium]|nr:hypothetical protein [Acidobacteriota bacterium]MCI0723132.1 hypothetical protein [Acidobacteriota bacterium]
MTKKFTGSILGAICAILVAANALQAQGVPRNSKVFITEMQGGLHSFIAPEIIKRKLPVVVVADENQADFVLVGESVKGDDKWHHTVFGGKDKNEGAVQLIDVKTKAIVWAGEAGDRSMMWGGWKRGGQRKVADRIVNQMGKDLFKK